MLVDTGSGASYALNATAALVWELCDGRRTRQAIVAELLERYDAPSEQVESSVARLLDELAALGVLDTAGSAAPELDTDRDTTEDLDTAGSPMSDPRTTEET